MTPSSGKKSGIMQGFVPNQMRGGNLRIENLSVAVYFGRHGDRLENSSSGYRGCSLERDELKRWRGSRSLGSSCFSRKVIIPL